MENDQIASAAGSAAPAPAPENVNAPANPSGAPDGAAPSAAAAPEPPKPESHSRLQKRIDELTKARYDEQRAREAAEARAAAIERNQQLSQHFSQLNGQMPQIDRFNSLQEYQAAMADWTAQVATARATAQWENRMQEMQARQAQVLAYQAQQAQEVGRENALIEERMSAGAKKYPDFAQVITNPELPQIRENPALLKALLTADHAEDIAYYAAKNPVEYERLLSMRDPIQIAREVFRLDQKFAGAGPSAAPPPPPQRNGSSVSGQKDWQQMSTAEHVKAYQSRHNRKRAG